MVLAETVPTRWTAQWKELFEEVITTGLCTGCAGCVVTCPHDVIGYEHAEGKYVPFHLEDELGPDRLHPRCQGLHDVHAGVSALPVVGADRPIATSSDGCASRTRWPGSGSSCC